MHVIKYLVSHHGILTSIMIGSSHQISHGGPTPSLAYKKKTRRAHHFSIQIELTLFLQLKELMKKLGASEEYKKGLWTVEEDRILMDYIQLHGKGKWNRIPISTGLKRCGKSCRLRWVNYLSPNIKRGDFSQEEDDLIIRLHNLLGNRWSLIAGRVPGRTDNQVKNHWNTHLNKKLGFNPTRRLPTLRRPDPAHLPLRLCHDSSCDKTTTEDDMSGKSNMPPLPRGALATENGRSSSVWFFDDELNLICAPNVVDSSGEFTLDFVLHGT